MKIVQIDLSGKADTLRLAKQKDAQYRPAADTLFSFAEEAQRRKTQVYMLRKRAIPLSETNDTIIA